MACKGKARIWRTNVFTVVVTYREFGVGALFVGVVDDADIAASENWPFFGVVGDCELH